MSQGARLDRLLVVGLVASAVALGADFMLVFAHLVGMAGVWTSAAVGGVALATMVLGYRGLKDVVTGKAGTVLARVGLMVGVIAPLLHLLTASVIASELQQQAGTPVPPSAPMGLPFIRVLWFLLLVMAVLGSLVFAVAVSQTATRLPRWMAAVTPASLALLICLGGLLTPWSDVVVVLSGNVAQTLFFLLLVLTVRPAAAQ